MQIKVPASSANLGPGFDSIGVAISLYLTIDVLEETDHWVVDHDLGDLPRDEKNMIVASALKIKPDLAPRHLRVESDIPLAHGLGSSSSAIVGGIELADKLGGMHLAPHEKIELASQLEGHPDNVAPTILGSLVVVCKVNGHFTAVKAPVPPFAMIAYIPAYNLKTSDARAVCQRNFPLRMRCKRRPWPTRRWRPFLPRTMKRRANSWRLTFSTNATGANWCRNWKLSEMWATATERWQPTCQGRVQR